MNLSIIVIIIMFLLTVSVAGYSLGKKGSSFRTNGNYPFEPQKDSAKSSSSSAANAAVALSAAAVAIMLVIVAIIAGKLSTIQNELRIIRSNESSISMMLSDLRQQLSFDKMLAASSSLDILDVNYDDRTALLHYSVNLKEYTGLTSVGLKLDGRLIPLEQTAAGTYGADFRIGIFEKITESTLCVTEDGKTVTEAIYMPEHVFWDFLPMPSFECSLSSGVKLGKLTYEGSYYVVTEHPDEIESVSVTYMTDGRDLITQDITKPVRGHEEIMLDTDMNVNKDLTCRVEILTKHGLRIIDQSTMIYEESFDETAYYSLRIEDMEGNVLWTEESY